MCCCAFFHELFTASVHLLSAEERMISKVGFASKDSKCASILPVCLHTPYALHDHDLRNEKERKNGQNSEHFTNNKKEKDDSFSVFAVSYSREQVLLCLVFRDLP